MEVGKQPQVLFNDQIKGVLKAEAGSANAVDKGSELTLADLGAIVGIQMTPLEGNAGHLTAIFHRNSWHLMFDFRYNAARIASHTAVAHQFLSLAETAAAAGHVNQPLGVSEEQINGWLTTAKAMTADLDDRRPRVHRVCSWPCECHAA